MSDGPSRERGDARRCERVFMLRLWREAGCTDDAATRGSIVEVATGRRFYFSGLTDLHDFLALRQGRGDRS